MVAFNINLILVLATLIAGIIWLADVLFFAKSRKKEKNTQTKNKHTKRNALAPIAQQPHLIIQYAKSFFPVLFMVVAVRSFLLEPFQIPSGSMIPTLQIGDFILVNKFSYGIRLPVGNYKVIETGNPERGDVMVFYYPNDQKTHFIKRVIGLPGDKISYKNKRLYINNQLVEEIKVTDPMPQPPMRFYQENLPSDQPHQKAHLIQKDHFASGELVAEEHTEWRNEWTVPAKHYFVMGDNRDNSNDSRFWGFVPDKLVVGKAFYIWMHWPELLSLPKFNHNKVIN